MHHDILASPGADAIVTSAKAHGVPVVSAKQMLDWLDGRNASSFSGLAWNGSVLSFSVSVGVGANGLQAMVPTTVTAGTLTTLTLNGSTAAFTRQTIKGIEYAIFQVAPAYRRHPRNRPGGRQPLPRLVTLRHRRNCYKPSFRRYVEMERARILSDIARENQNEFLKQQPALIKRRMK
jgi:hypothetical protein